MEKIINDNSNEDEKNFKYIYFIMTYDKFKQFKVYLSPEYKGSNTLEKINEISLNVENAFLSSDVYRFRIIEDNLILNKDHKDCHIPVNVESEKEKYQYVIKLRDLKKDFYEYNFEIKKFNILLLDYRKQFEIYIDILRNKFSKEQNSPENEDLILSTQSLLTGKDKKYNFLFYLLILLECFSTKYIYRHLLIFKPEKIIELGEVEKEKLEQIKNKLNTLTVNPEKIHLENGKDKQKTIESFYSVVLYFNLNFQKEKVKDMFENEQYCEYLYEKFNKFGNFFEGLILSKKNVINLIKKTDDYNQVLNILFYLGKDVIQFLEVINEEKEYLEKLFQKEKEKKEKKEIPYIEVSKYVYPKKEDDVKMINTIIYELNLFKKNNKLSFVKFSKSFIEKYIEFNSKINTNNLIYIRNIVQNSNFFNELDFNINELKPSLVGSDIKIDKQFEDEVISRKFNYQKTDNKLLPRKYDIEKKNINDINTLRNHRHSIVSSNKIGLSSILDIFKIDNDKNLINNKVFHDKKDHDSNLNDIITKLKYDLRKEKDINNELIYKNKILEKIIKNKEKEINTRKKESNDLNKMISDMKSKISKINNEVKELLEQLKKKEDKIKELKEKFSFEYTKEDKIFPVTFLSINEDIHYSMICKNTDEFQRLENSFYEKFPEYKNCKNIFLIHNKIINKYEKLETNNIRDNDVIIFKTQIDEEK